MKKLLRSLFRWAMDDGCNAIAMAEPIGRHGAQHVSIGLALNGYVLSYYDNRQDKHVTMVSEGGLEDVNAKLVTILGRAHLDN